MQRRRKVLLTSLSGQLGGMELRLADEARLLKQLGHAPCLGISHFVGCDAWLAALRSEGLELADFNPPPFLEEWRWRRFNLLRARLAALPALKGLAPDLVHVAYAWTTTGGSRLWVAERCGVPTVISIHNAFPPAEFAPWSRRRMATAFRLVRGIYGVSESARTQFEAIYGDYLPTRVISRTIYNFVDVNRFVPSQNSRRAARAELGIPEHAFVVGSIGRIDVQKEPLSVARVFARSFDASSSAYLVFIGQGPLRTVLEREIARLGIGERAVLTGFRDDVECLFPALDVHILLSKQEGFGITTAEAMACEVPVIATNVPGTRDVLTGTNAGLLVPYGDESEAAHALRVLFDSPERRLAMGRAGRVAAVSRFSKERWEGAIARFYQDTMP